MTLHERLEELFQNVLGNDSISLRDDMTSADVPGWDSVAHVNLMFTIEQTFGVQFKGNELAEFPNIGALKAYLARYGT